MNADIIFVVAGGEIVEQGTHEELLEKRGKYSELWSKQIFVKPKEKLQDDDNTSLTADERDKDSSDDALTVVATTNSEDDSFEVPQKSQAASADSSKPSPPVEQTQTTPNTCFLTTPVKTPNRHKKEVDQSKNP